MSVIQLVWIPISLTLSVIEKFLFVLINWYDAYCYSPLQTTLSPLVARIPRAIEVKGHKVNVFTANIASWTRTFLVIPIAWCLKYNHPVIAFLCVLFHDFLDHLDGIVAKVQKSVYGQLDDPLLGGFMDAFCDKIVNCLALWSILLVTDFSQMTTQQCWMFVSACTVIIAYEFVLGVVRVQDYFQAFYSRKYESKTTESTPNVAAVMEGKLKEKLESMGIAFLCMAQTSTNPCTSTSGITGIVCLLLSIRLAHASLEHKLKPRRSKAVSSTETERALVQSTDVRQLTTSVKSSSPREEPLFPDIKRNSGERLNVIPTDSIKVPSLRKRVSIALLDDSTQTYEEDNTRNKEDTRDENGESDVNDADDDDEGEKSDVSSEKEAPRTLMRSHSVPTWKIGSLKTVDKVYTVGCFDLFHDGHRILLERLSQLGKQVIVGVHDSRSIFKLKKKVPIDSTTKRMSNVKKHASMVFCIHGTDPTPYLKCMYDADEICDSMYVRGDDMPNFPARKFIESVMPIHFLPYSEFISSTKIRKEFYNASMFGPHVNDVDADHASMFY
ncbi:uncharacterized protein LOC127844441 isoform X2 [Dreissena polymorpha]|uniref:Cytidyltransferase-like domain-containing protein n=2 Tax=Dreissena polymorpha TaxID=45954 RepID=A0A9D4E176_DREPO|nr:uncharacterized protein LOC127844441 isoform X2 [Dreissena polymorpha]KAH3770174.1 hypothetical protein DPMN_171457 [Dreissena polymorpha]